MARGYLHCRRVHEVQYLAFVINNQMLLKTEEAVHRASSPFRYTFECLVDEYALAFAYS